MINWVLQLNINQLESSFDSLVEKHLVLNFPNQPNPNPIQSVIDRGKPEDTERVFVYKGRTSCSREIVGERLQGELSSSDRTGKPVKSEDIRVMHAHDGTGEPVIKCKHTHSERNLFLPNIVTMHHLTRTTSSTVQPIRRTLTSTFQECRIQQ